MLRIIAGLLLMFACTTAFAHEVKKHGADSGGGACDEMVTAPASHAASPAKPTTRQTQAAPAPAKPVSQRDGGDADASLPAPRWHSFLPGMFR